MGRESVIGVEISCGLDGTGIESRWRREFRIRPDRLWDLPNLLYNGYRVIPGDKAAGPWFLSPGPSSAYVKKE